MQLASELRCDLVVIGPEVPLVAGLADDVRAAGMRVFGPGAEAARLEGSKAFAKDVMQAAGVPTARHLVLTRLDEVDAAVDELGGACVVKADGLAAGKGVVVAGGRDEAIDAARSFLVGRGARRGRARRVVLEELLVGRGGLAARALRRRLGAAAAAAHATTSASATATAARTPAAWARSRRSRADAGEAARLCDARARAGAAELERRGARFTGCLYAGLMLTADGPRMLEFNVRFGDPETQAILPLLEGDLAAALHAVAIGAPDPSLVRVADGACVSLVLASAGYPGSPTQGDAIDGIDEAAARDGVSVFHSGTALHGGRLVTAGGRVLAISAVAPDLAAARERAYAAAGCVRFDGRQLRSDIGGRADGRPCLRAPKVSSEVEHLFEALDQDGPMVGIVLSAEAERPILDPAVEELEQPRHLLRGARPAAAPRSPRRRRVRLDRGAPRPAGDHLRRLALGLAARRRRRLHRAARDRRADPQPGPRRHGRAALDRAAAARRPRRLHGDQRLAQRGDLRGQDPRRRDRARPCSPADARVPRRRARLVDCTRDRPLRQARLPCAVERRAKAGVVARGRARRARRLVRARRRPARGRRGDPRAAHASTSTAVARDRAAHPPRRARVHRDGGRAGRARRRAGSTTG